MQSANPLRANLAPVIFVDDNESFLAALKLTLAHDLQSVSFSNPLDALDYIENALVDGASGSHVSRSVLVVDYSMPQLNGLELCERLKRASLRKVLLTGQIVTKDVLDAFDKKIIDAYINKSDGDFLDALRAAITK